MSYGKCVIRGRERKTETSKGLELWQVLWKVYREVYIYRSSKCLYLWQV